MTNDPPGDVEPRDGGGGAPPPGGPWAVGSVVLAVSLLLVVGLALRALLGGDEQDASDGGSVDGADLLALAAWTATVVLTVAAVAALRDGGAGRDRPSSRPGHEMALRLTLVLAVVASAAVATWLTVDRARNLTEQEVQRLADDVGRDLAGGDEPSLTDVEASLARQLGDEPDPDEPVDGPPRGLRVEEADVSSSDGREVFQLSDDDGGSPVCLWFEAPGQYADVDDGWTASTATGTC